MVSGAVVEVGVTATSVLVYHGAITQAAATQLPTAQVAVVAALTTARDGGDPMVNGKGGGPVEARPLRWATPAMTRWRVATPVATPTTTAFVVVTMVAVATAAVATVVLVATVAVATVAVAVATVAVATLESVAHKYKVMS